MHYKNSHFTFLSFDVESNPVHLIKDNFGKLKNVEKTINFHPSNHENIFTFDESNNLNISFMTYKAGKK